MHGITLAKKAERTGWKRSEFKKLWETSAQDEERLKGVSLVTDNGYLTVLEGDAEQEVHYFAGEDTIISTGREKICVLKNQNTASFPIFPLPASRIKIQEKEKTEITYIREPISDMKNARLLSMDFDEYVEEHFEEFATRLDSDEKMIRADLLRCHPQDIYDLKKHLYYALTELNGETRGWLLRNGGGVENIYSNYLGKKNISPESEIIGPIKEDNFFRIDWEGEKGTHFSLETESHREQIDTYLSAGFFSLRPNVNFYDAGILTNTKSPFLIPQEGYVSKTFFEFKDEYLNFDPRAYCIFFDKDSFFISCDLKEDSYTICAKHHSKRMNITPKTVFMVYPAGGQPIIGSHALPPVKLSRGKNYIVLPGLTFEFNHGINYYIV